MVYCKCCFADLACNFLVVMSMVMLPVVFPCLVVWVCLRPGLLRLQMVVGASGVGGVGDGTRRGSSLRFGRVRVLWFSMCRPVGHRSANALRRQVETGIRVSVGFHLPHAACASSEGVPKKFVKYVRLMSFLVRGSHAGRRCLNVRAQVCHALGRVRGADDLYRSSVNNVGMEV